MQGSLLVQNSNCGCATTRQNWDPLTALFMKALSAAIGYNPQVGNALDQIVALAKAGGDTSIIYTTRHWIIKVGAPVEALSPSKKVDASVFNGDTFVIPETIGLDVNDVRVATQNSEPTSTGYNHDPNTGTFNFTYPIYNAFVYFETVTYNSDNVGAGVVYYGTKSDFTLPTESEIEQGELKNYTEGLDVDIPFTGSNQIYWMAWLATDDFSGFYVNDLDNGTFGDQTTIDTPVIIGKYKFAQVNYVTTLGQTTLKH